MQAKEEYDSGEWQVSPQQANEFRTRVKEIYSVLGQALASLDNVSMCRMHFHYDMHQPF